MIGRGRDGRRGQLADGESGSEPRVLMPVGDMQRKSARRERESMWKASRGKGNRREHREASELRRGAYEGAADLMQ